jgi:glycosyltransferase involved in cell wall biosynthesis
LLHRLINFYGLPTDRVQLCKYTSNVLPIIVGSDLLVMPSLSEGTPFAMVEAMSCGRPAVGTPVGGIPELIIEGETGWLARSTEVGDVADALERAWAARPQWPIYGAQAQASTAANYDQNRTVLDLIEALQQDIHNAHD